MHMYQSDKLMAMQSGAGSAVSWASLFSDATSKHATAPPRSQHNHQTRPNNALAQLILSGVEPLAPGLAQCCHGWMGRKCLSFVLPALQELQLQAISAQARKPCVCAAVCFVVLLLPRSCSRHAESLPKKTKQREVLLFRVHTSATSPRLPPPILCCCSALGRHPAPRTRHFATERARPSRTLTKALTSRRSTVL
jgi:hypothetical protein